MQDIFRSLTLTSTLGIALLSLSSHGAEAQKSKPRKVSVQNRSGSASYGARGTASGIEKSLLGIRVLQSYKSVLARYGQPTRVYRLGETLEFVHEMDANGKYTGGISGLVDMANAMGATGGSGKQGGPPGGYSPPGGGGGRQGGPPSGYGPPGGYSPPGGGGGGGRQGGPPSGYGPPGGYSPPGGGGGGADAGGGGLNGANAQQDNTFKASGGYLWVYVYPDKRASVFLFNKDGRCEAILQLGRFNGQATSRGITLGSPIADVYRTYGWPESSEYSPVSISLYYNDKYHLQVEVLNNKVVGLLVCLSEDQKYKIAKADGGGTGGGQGGAPGGQSGGGGGRPGGKGGGGGAAASAD